MVIPISTRTLIIIKRIIKFFIGIALTIALGLFLFFIWIFLEPREFPAVASYISREITDVLPNNTQFTMQGVLLGFDADHRLLLKLNNINFKGARGTLELSSVNVFFDLLALLPQSHHNWLNIEIPSPKLNLQKVAESDGADLLPIFARLNSYFQEHKDQIVKFGLSVADIELAFALNETTNVKLLVNRIKFRPSILDDKLLFYINGDFNIGGRNNELNATLDTNSNQHLKIGGLVNNISHLTLNAFGLNLPELESSSIEGDLKFDVILNNLSSIEHADFQFSNFAGVIKQNEFFPKDFTPKELLIKGNCQQNCSLIELEKVRLIDDVLNFEGKFLINTQNSPTLKGEFKLRDLPVNSVKDYWPKPVTPRTREWIFNHISEGKIKQALGNVNIDLEEVLKKKNIKRDDIEITLYLEDTTVVYADKVPVIYDVDAIIQINGEEIKFSIPEARILNSKIENLNGFIPDLGTAKSRVDVEAKIQGRIQDVIDIGFAHTDVENVLYKNLYGNATSSVKVSVPLDDRDINLDIIKLDVETDITDINVQKIFRDLNLTEGKLHAKYMDKAAYITGTVKVNGIVNADVDVKQSFENSDRHIQITLHESWKNLSGLGFSVPDIIAGKFKQQIEIDEAKDAIKNTIEIDLTDSLIDQKTFGIKKQQGEPGTLKLQFFGDSEHSKTPITIDSYSIKLPNFQSEGKAVVDSNFSQINSISSNSTQFGNSNFKLDYKFHNGMKSINISGKSLDLSSFDLFNMQKSEEGVGSNRKLNISAKVDELFLKDEVKILSSYMEIDCDTESCKKVKLLGNFNATDKLAIELNTPLLKIYSNNAGQFFKAFGIPEEIEKGELNINGKNEDAKWTGRFEIKNFKTRNVPFLAKILSIASITLTDLESLSSFLTGSGITFKSFECPYEYNKGILHLSECVSLGRSMAISFDGKIDFNTRQVNINGVLVPQNIINVILRNVPIVNQFFGTKAEEGAIGVSFVMQGSIDDPKVYSNPLSILAPGFLKKIFDTNAK